MVSGMVELVLLSSRTERLTEDFVVVVIVGVMT